MFVPENKQVLVIGLGASGCAAAKLLRARGARVTAVDAADTPALRLQTRPLYELGCDLRLGQSASPDQPFDLAVLSPGVPPTQRLVRGVRERGVPVISELELGWQQCYCPAVGITGTNGKTTTTELVERVLSANGLKTLAAGNIGLPLCAVAGQSRDLDWVTLEVSSFQLEAAAEFRPRVAVLLNITPDHLDRYANMDEYARAKARLFSRQLADDWAIVQSDALRELRRLGVNIRGRLITFSATDDQADLFCERGRLGSRLAGWPGLLLDLAQCRLRGPHNAENLLAALAVGRVLGLPLAGVVQALNTYSPAPHRCELVAEIDGVRYVNDSKATNVDAVAKALLTVGSQAQPAAPNIWLLAGGKDKGFDFHELGPLLKERVKGAFLFGETRDKLRAAWGGFTTCATVESLLEGISEAAKNAVSGDVVLLSPACSSFDQFQNYQHRGEVFRQRVLGLAQTRREGATHRCELRAGAGAPARAVANVTKLNFAAGLNEGQARSDYINAPQKGRHKRH
jgi:UDP-N-acetylmuramoylalanine--D-glutamate ligase